MEREQFFKKYNIIELDFQKTNLKWEDLLAIEKQYQVIKESLVVVGNAAAEILRKHDKVHSIRMRMKDSEHLMEKIIRRQKNDPDLDINLGNFESIITDLIGVRALHLYKGDWDSIHDFILDNWTTKGEPTAYYRNGDPDEVIKKYEEKGCLAKGHPYGYRSVHYVVEAKATKKPTLIEIQVRTIFEEAWSEIDHQVRYPYDLEHPITLPFLLIFNQFAGNADSMGSFIKSLKENLEENKEHLNRTTEELKATIEKSKVHETEKEKLLKEIESLKARMTYIASGGFQYYGASIKEPVIFEKTKCDKCGNLVTPHFSGVGGSFRGPFCPSCGTKLKI